MINYIPDKMREQRCPGPIVLPQEGFMMMVVKVQLGPSLELQFSSVAQWHLTLWDPVDCSTPGLPVHHQLLEFTQTHVHQVGISHLGQH